MVLVLSLACTLATHAYYSMQLSPIHLLSAISYVDPHMSISALFMHLPSVLWAWICAPATNILGAPILITVIFYSSCSLNRLAATLAFPLLCNCTVLPVPLSTGPYLDSPMYDWSYIFTMYKKTLTLVSPNCIFLQQMSDA